VGLRSGLERGLRQLYRNLKAAVSASVGDGIFLTFLVGGENATNERVIVSNELPGFILLWSSRVFFCLVS
jgi:hypothetical protein